LVVFKEDVDVPLRELELRLLVSVFFLEEPIAIVCFVGAATALGAGAAAGGGGGGGATGGRGGGVGATYGAGALDPKHIRFHPFYLISIPPRTFDLRDTSRRLCRLME
jgi:hypothetical protein